MDSSSALETNLATAKTVMTTVASVAATAMVARSIIQDYLPYEFQHFLLSGIRKFFNGFSSQTTMVIDEFDGLVNNQIYEAAETYLGGKISPSMQRLKVSKSEKENNFVVTVEKKQMIVDVFNGVKFRWILVCSQVQANRGDFYNPRDLNSTLRSEVRSFELSFHKKHLDLVLKSYLPHILRESKLAKQEKKTLKIFTLETERHFNMTEAWVSTNLDHPATFETLALESEIKNFILEDLERFVKRKDYYRKIGKAWKRGCLLYGPPGTGKSSLIAAMANYLNFDVYDLELTEVRANTDLKKMLISMANRSILVVEDIDCSVDFHDRNMAADQSTEDYYNPRRKQLTLSGFLNFIDGLWSSCGDERIIIFTTNHKEKLDPALLRPGRMDVHVHLSYCTPCGFRVLASNYLGINDHSLFAEIEQRVQATEVTPAEIAEELLKSDDPDIALQGLIEFLKVKKLENEETKAKKEKEEAEAAKKGDEKNSAQAESKDKEGENNMFAGLHTETKEQS
ncbi:AAA-ATPase At3g50940 [Morus notabilis]|uniref:AAA-ATPase At3g50940 n=1 Tax=Morus notabilis TaxID=981085 RepID=UPI000CED0E6F|nr:AAA-ATPase At3g50940 [Morus notabilis]